MAESREQREEISSLRTLKRVLTPSWGLYPMTHLMHLKSPNSQYDHLLISSQGKVSRYESGAGAAGGHSHSVSNRDHLHFLAHRKTEMGQCLLVCHLTSSPCGPAQKPQRGRKDAEPGHCMCSQRNQCCSPRKRAAEEEIVSCSV